MMDTFRQRSLPHPHPGFAHLLPSREKAPAECARFHRPLPLWERVPEGRVRGTAPAVRTSGKER